MASISTDAPEKDEEGVPKYALLPFPGTRDFFPDQMVVREWLFRMWDAAASAFNFRKYDGPLIEHTELYTRKGNSDDILSEMFTFRSAGRSVCLRPEMTPTLARMALATHEVRPLKWYCIAQMWRFEFATSASRKREHFQFNSDIIGGEPVKSDVEILALIAAFFEQVGLTPAEVTIRCSHRGLLQSLFESVGVPPSKIRGAFNLVDKLDKLSREEVAESLIVNLGITDQAVATIFRFTEIGTIDDLWTLEIPTDLWRTSVENITSIFKLAQAYGIDKWLSYDGSIVRGLSYYDGIVFEGFFRGKEFKKALLGGGRYNNLTEQYKKSCKMSGVGFGMGDIVIAQVLAATGKIPNLARSVPYCVGAYNEDFFPIALDIARGLRASGQKVDVCAKTGMGPVLTYASKIGANSAIIVTPSEWAQGQVLVKNLTTGVQTSTPVGDLSLA